MCTHMGSVNISIKKEAYEFLNELKKEDQSFSDIILSFKKDRGNVMKYFGALKEKNWQKREKEMHNFRKEFEAR